MKRQLFYLLGLVILFSACQDEPASDSTPHLGIVSFTPDCDEDAVILFEEGLLLLHSFEYADARKEFAAAREVDPDCAMAYWGEAMTYNHPLWAAQYTDEAREVLSDLGATKEERLAKAGSDIERDLLTGVEILFSEDQEDKFERDKEYARHMADLYKKYPSSHEVAAFYALSLLGSSIERDEATYEKGAIVARSILEENPEHPGALHYLIHAYDDPGHAKLALNAADAYSKIAPDAGHALHMPSHIYVALGMWDENISSNIDSWNASESRKERLDLDNNALNYHALQWLMYGLLQQSRTDTARQLVDAMAKYTEELPSSRARAYLTVIRAGFIAETSDWSSDLNSLEVDDSDLNITFKATNNFVRGMAAYAENDTETIKSIISEMEATRQEEHKKLMQRGSAMCSGIGWATQLPTQQDINHSHIMEMELQAMASQMAGDNAAAESWFEKATELQDNTSFVFGPPTVVKPSHELYGEWLFQQERYDDAIEQFDRALELAPNRAISTRAKEAAQNKSGTSI